MRGRSQESNLLQKKKLPHTHFTRLDNAPLRDEFTPDRLTPKTKSEAFVMKKNPKKPSQITVDRQLLHSNIYNHLHDNLCGATLRGFRGRAR